MHWSEGIRHERGVKASRSTLWKGTIRPPSGSVRGAIESTPVSTPGASSGSGRRKGSPRIRIRRKKEGTHTPVSRRLAGGSADR